MSVKLAGNLVYFTRNVELQVQKMLTNYTKNQSTNINVCHIGSLNASIANCREVFKPVILSNSNASIVYHEHPSNGPIPSREDVEVTKRLVKAGKIIGIDVLEHVIVCDDSFVSLKRADVRSDRTWSRVD